LLHDDFIPAPGRSVVYQVAEGEFRPAQIVRVWSTEGPRTVNLVVFVDGSNDRHLPCAAGASDDDLRARPLLWKTSITLGDAGGVLGAILNHRR
jgi:hypothetical protein